MSDLRAKVRNALAPGVTHPEDVAYWTRKADDATAAVLRGMWEDSDAIEEPHRKQIVEQNLRSHASENNITLETEK